MRRSLLFLIAICLPALLEKAAAAPMQDAQPPDSTQILEFIGKIRAQQKAAVKQRRATAMEAVKAAANNAEKAAALWKDAVKAVQIEGSGDEAAKLRAFREGDGDLLNEKEAQTAAKLHITWLFYTLQFQAGVKKKDLVPLVIEYTNQLMADGQTMETFQENIEKAREREASAKHGTRKTDDNRVKQMHDLILSTPVGASPVAKYLGLEDILPRGTDTNDRTAKAVAKLLGTGQTPVTADDSWPMSPGDLDGIHRAILLPEYRQMKDRRLLDYWDYVIKREADVVAKRKVNYDEVRFNTVRRPELVWQRAHDLLGLGLRNRAIIDMVAVIKANPLHPQADTWMTELENLLRTSAAAADAPLVPPPADK